MSAPVLIVGAGPTGLVLALRLHRHGIPFRIVEQHDGPGEASRALIVHARTLEFYAQLGLADRLIAAGTKVDAVRMREAGEDVGRFSLNEMGRGLSPYPFALCLPQDEHERLLVEALAQAGVAVEWGVKLDRVEQLGDSVVATLSSHHGVAERAVFAYVAGCDGARSRVREQLGIAFEGGTYDRLYYVADVRPRQRPGSDLCIALDRNDFGLMLPARRGENERLIGFVPQDREQAPTFDDVRASAQRLLGIEVADVHWFSTYRVHHRVAARFRQGRCFLLGDAGHVHSPVGGQGMNTGIGDAVNLGWKLADVIDGRASPELLQTYDSERIAFARTLVATTDQAFRVITDDGVAGRVLRTWVMPHLLPSATRFSAGRHAMFRVLSQIRIAYPDSPLSSGTAGGVTGGDRLPWVAEAENHAPLRSLRWQLHVFGETAPPLRAEAGALGLDVQCFDWSDAAREAGFRDRAAYLVRPDSHVALAFDQDASRLRAYCDRLGLRFTPPAAGGTTA